MLVFLFTTQVIFYSDCLKFEQIANLTRNTFESANEHQSNSCQKSRRNNLYLFAPKVNQLKDRFVTQNP